LDKDINKMEDGRGIMEDGLEIERYPEVLSLKSLVD